MKKINSEFFLLQSILLFVSLYFYEGRYLLQFSFVSRCLKRRKRYSWVRWLQLNVCHSCIVNRQQYQYITQTKIQGMFKKRLNFLYKDFVLQHFKHCPLPSSPLYWQYTVPNVSSIVGMLPGTHLLWWRAVLLSHFPESLHVQKKTKLFK